ncbi:NERD domain-containing protein [Niallia sp. Krafla_26]|uniref:NERD domain-containing protein n=1 Tax=Niallia sp. Krafla_26 TaxID=3064703 RepID=UPI003D17BD3B
MGQLIKLQDYTSRYEQNIYHYSARFVTLKKQQWEKVRKNWDNPGNYSDRSNIYESIETGDVDENKYTFLEKIKTLFQRGHSNLSEIEDLSNQETQSLEENEFSSFKEIFDLENRPATIDELKRLFLNQLFEFQMTWATSTLVEKSFVNKRFYYDERLKYFLQRFPDTYLTLYRPVFKLKKATIEVETILIGPTDIWCITFVEDADLSVFIGNQEKFWSIRNKNHEKKIINPLIALNRMGKIVKKILELSEVQLPVHKVLLCRNGFIDHPTSPYDVVMIDKRNYEEWFQNLRSLRSPLKAAQLKGAEALLQFCQTSAVKRIEWEVWDRPSK